MDEPVPLVSRQHNKVVSVANQTCVRLIARSVTSVKRLVEPVQERICQEGRNHATLGRSLPWATPLRTLTILVDDRSL